MTQNEIERLLELVKRQVGVREQPKGSNRGMQVDGYTGGRAEPWCAHFVAWCFRSVGKSLPNDVIPSPKRANPLASVAFMERIFKELDWHYMAPQVGDIVFFATRGRSDRGPGRHVGIVIGVDAKTKSIEVVDGNWGDAVNRRTISLEKPSIAITGFGRVP